MKKVFKERRLKGLIGTGLFGTAFIQISVIFTVFIFIKTTGYLTNTI